MIPITAEIRAMIDKAASSLTVGEDEYTDPADGLLHCRACGHPRQAVVEAPFLNRVIFPRCACPCEVEKRQRREEARIRQERLERIKRRRSQGLQARYLYDYTFANDSGENPAMDKIRAYKLQEQGLDTVEANIHLGHNADERDYGVGAQILNLLGIRKMRLLTNNPVKRIGLEGYGLEVVENVPIEVAPNPYNLRYMHTKKERMGHDLNEV